MAIYIITYTILIAATRLSSKCGSRRCSLLLNTIGAIPLVFIGGMRSILMGVDASSYPVQVYEYSIGHSLIDAIQHVPVEWLFVTIGWICTKLFNSVNSILMVMQAITVLPVVYYFNRYHRSLSWLGVAVFLLIVYPWSINIIRQTAASGILLIAFCFAREDRVIPFVIMIAIACGLHITSISGFILWPICRYYSSVKVHKFNYILSCIIGVFIVLIYRFAPQLIHYFAQFKDSYTYQIEYIGRGYISNSYTVMCLSCLLLYGLLMCGRPHETLSQFPISNSYVNVKISISLVLLSLFLSLLSTVSPALFRLGFMYSIFMAVFFCDVLNLATDKRLTFLVMFAIIIISVLYFYITYIVNVSSGAIPYHSELLSI